MQSSDIEYLSSNTNNNDSIKKLKSNLSSSKLNEKPCRPPRNADLSQKILNRNTNFEHKKSFSSSIYDSQTTNLNENIYKTLNNLNFCDSEETRESNSNGYNFGKPTVQVNKHFHLFFLLFLKLILGISDASFKFKCK